VWEPMYSGIPLTRVDMLKMRPSDNTVVAATHGRGLYTGVLKDESMSVIWTERGPQNVGGRTRTIMIDPNVKSNKKIWAGSVSGGLFKINNIDSIYFYVPDDKAIFDLNVLSNPIGENGSWLHIELGSQELITIKLYDMHGRAVETIIENKSFIGAHDLKWMPSINHRPGIYFLSMQSGANSNMNKVMLY
ncbi:MAG: T9SS type A sorting domain-containing protein, partial [Bacteroidetes bacterium]|nr:T9SS type A sorting domain-containing protein [Bacteroidota bacterium]